MYKRVWKVKCTGNGFYWFIFLRGTERELQEYIATEFKGLGMVSYIGATDKEVEAAKTIGSFIYCI